jgi:hypothetical protein
MARRRAHYVLSTHWDREWYLPAQQFRYRLVQLLDAVLDGLADGRLGGPFQTDGQALLVEDYLEIRPERRAQLAELAKIGKLAIGPWYSVPDEFLVSGESLVRNLRMGLRAARALSGEPSRAGWVCDQFGHISQLPQIFAGFGIGAAFLWRGVNEVGSRHFHWRGADGTVLPTYRFGDVGYCSFAFRVRRTERPDLTPEHEQLWEDLEQFLADEAARTAVSPLLIFDGGDHLAWDEAVYQVVDGYRQWADAPYALEHTSLDAYMAELLPQADQITHEISGELREPASMPQAEDRHWLIPGVLASRVWIKQENAACESLLTQWAEPLSAWASLAVGGPSQQAFLDSAWRWLLQNHPHDSMGGCSVDQVHADMRYRFSQCRQIGEQLVASSMAALAAAAAGALAADELRVVVFNPLAQPFDEPAELNLDIPTSWPGFNEFFGFEPQPAFRIYGPDGVELPYQRLGQAMNSSRLRLSQLKFPDPYRVHAVRVSLALRIPPLGYLALTLRPGALDALPPHPSIAPSARPTRHPAAPSLATSERSLENAFLSVTIEPNGSLTLVDKRSGAVYTRLLTFEDGADIGDGWYHGVALADQIYSSVAAPASVALVQSGPLLATLRVRVSLRLPSRFDFASMGRSEELVELNIDSLVSLRRDAQRVEVETTIHNTVADHRLRVLFPSGAQADTCLSDGAFDVVERPIALRADNHSYRELEVESRPQQSWTAVYGGGRGLAVVSSGLLEAAVRDQPERPLALTLLRSTRRTVLTDGEPDGLLLGMYLRFRYWIVPLAEEPDRAQLCRLGQQLAAGLRAAHVSPIDQERSPTQRSLPASASLLALEGPAVLSSLLWASEGLELRLFNPNKAAAEVRLLLPGACRSAQRIDLEGNPLYDAEDLHQSADERTGPEIRVYYKLTLVPKQIVSLRLTLTKDSHGA